VKRSIILEGYDGAGKTSLGRVLSDKLGLQLYHAGPPAKSDLHAGQCMRYQLTHLREGCIYDRVTPISRVCYQLNLRPMHLQTLRNGLVRMTEYSTIVWCKPDHYTFTRCDHDTDEHIRDITARKQQIISIYAKLFQSIPHIVFNYQTTSWSHVLWKLRQL